MASHLSDGIPWPNPISIHGKSHELSLLFVPKDSDAFYGGEALNWDWPRQSADFAIFQIHSIAEDGLQNGLPMHANDHQNGDKVMVLGYPASTMRWVSESEFQSSQSQVIWEENLQREWGEALQKSDLYSQSGFTPDSRLKHLAPHLPTAPRKLDMGSQTQCESAASFELYFLAYLQWSSKYLDCAVQNINLDSCNHLQDQLNPMLEQLLLRTTVANDPFAQERSRHVKRLFGHVMDENAPPMTRESLVSSKKHQKLANGLWLNATIAIEREESTNHCQPQYTSYPDADKSLRYSYGFIEGHTKSGLKVIAQFERFSMGELHFKHRH